MGLRKNIKRFLASLLLILGICSKHLMGQNQIDPLTYCQDSDAHHEHYFSCCNGKSYLLGHFVPHLFSKCLFRPVKSSLSFEDSQWNYYTCIVMEALGDKNLTLISYAKMMATNLDPDLQEDILWHVGLSIVNNSLNVIGRMKNIWEIYFDADYKVCTKKFDPDEFTVRQAYPGERGLRQYWEPSIKCKNFKIPLIVDLFKYTDGEHFQKCWKYLSSCCGSMIMQSTLSYFCSTSKPNGVTFKDVALKDFNFQELINQIHQPYMSLSSRQTYNNYLVDNLIEKELVFNHSNIFENFAENVYKNQPFLTQELNEGLIQSFKNIQAIEMVFTAAQYARSKICG